MENISNSRAVGMTSNFGHRSRSRRPKIFGYGRRPSSFGPTLKKPRQICLGFFDSDVTWSNDAFKLAVRLRTREASKNQVVFVCLCFVWLLPFSLINGEIVFLLLSWASLRYVYIWWSFWWYFLWQILWRFFGQLFWLIFDFFWWIFLTFFFSFLALSVSLFN